jgi:hypothetical protein
MICRQKTIRCRQLFRVIIKKLLLAANNGDMLGEAVISVKRKEFGSGQQRKIRL